MKRVLVSFFVVVSCGGTGEKKNAEGDLQGEVSACIEGESCDDGNPCTYGDLCVAGVCAGTDYAQKCAVEKCAVRECDGSGGCLEPVVKPGWCLIDQTCVPSGEPNPNNMCEVCDPEQRTDGFVPAENGTPCSDGNPCTEDDYCDSGDCLPGSPPSCPDGVKCTQDSCDPDVGCVHMPLHEECDDGNPCTVDLCDINAGGCTNTPDDTAFCGDGNVCTLNDHCEGGKCVSDPEPMNCDDDNECTDDFCHPSYGCLHVFNNKPCDDSASCTTGDVCSFGKCEGKESPWNPCPPCNLIFSDQIAKISMLRIGDGGHPGEALNIDNDLKTCSPPGNCELGLDNSLSLLGDFINEYIAESLANSAESPLIFLIELVDPVFTGEKFVINMFYAELSSENPDCDLLSEKCVYDAFPQNFNAICEPQISFNNAQIVDGVLEAGGSGYIFPLKTTFVNGKEAVTVLYAARVKATVTLDQNGNVVKLSGVLGGAITSDNLVELIEAAPDEYVPLEKELLISLVKNLPQDIDLNGDGTLDGSSIALVFETIPGVLNPYYD